MTDTSRSNNDIGSEEDIRKLLMLAGPRRQPPADLEARIRAATMAAVADLPEPERSEPRRWFSARLPVAAAVLVSLLAGYFLLPGSDAPSAASIVFTSGGYTVRGSDAGGDSLAAGAIVRTSSSGRMLIDLGDERSLRLDRNTSLTLHDDSEIWLHRGRVYVDSAGGTQLTVVTPNASISDIGTQFEVSVDDELLHVATREGSVSVRVGSEEILSRAEPGTGESLQIDGLELLARTEISTSGKRWEWTQLARPLFDAKNRSISDYLE